MPAAKVNALRGVDIGVTHLDAALRFYTEVWNLDHVTDADNAHYLRGTGAFHHILSLRQAPTPCIIRVVFDAADRTAIDKLHAQVKVHGAGAIDPPTPLAWPGGGYGFGCKDREGRNYAVVTGVADHADCADKPDHPRRLSHVNLNTGDNDATFAFFRDALGFTLSDTTRRFRFIRCNADHHCMVLAFHDWPSLNHIAFEMPDLDSVMRGAGRMIDHGYPIEWGPGRHGPGQNVFCYFCGPEELPLEYTGEMLQIDDNYRAGSPEDWTWPPGRLDRWGISAAPSRRVERAGELFSFTPDGYRLHT